MSDYWIMVCLSLLAALVFAMSTSLKHISAGRVPDAQDMQLGSLARFIPRDGVAPPVAGRDRL